MAAFVTGACYCGGVAYRVPDDFAYGGYCHCSRCRRQSGADHSAFVAIAESRIQIMRGADLLRRYAKPGSSPGALHFCGNCGSCLWGSFESDGTMIAHMQLGTFDTPPSTRPGRHFCVASKAPWEMLPDDGLPRFDGLPA